MPAVAPVPYVPYRQFTDDGHPLAGGRLYPYAAGTDTPLATYQDPQGTVLHSHPVVLDDAGYAPLYLLAGTPYKLVQQDSAGVQQWVVDQVYGSGSSGGSSLAGVGWGHTTVAVLPGAGAAQAVAAVFPALTLALGLTVWFKTGLGTSQGLTSVGLGSRDQPNAWGVLTTFAGETETTVGGFVAYGAQPCPTAGTVLLTAYGGRFDGVGELYLTGHWLTLTPFHTVGQSTSN